MTGTIRTIRDNQRESVPSSRAVVGGAYVPHTVCPVVVPTVAILLHPRWKTQLKPRIRSQSEERAASGTRPLRWHARLIICPILCTPGLNERVPAARADSPLRQSNARQVETSHRVAVCPDTTCSLFINYHQLYHFTAHQPPLRYIHRVPFGHPR